MTKVRRKTADITTTDPVPRSITANRKARIRLCVFVLCAAHCSHKSVNLDSSANSIGIVESMPGEYAIESTRSFESVPSCDGIDPDMLFLPICPSKTQSFKLVK